MKARLYFDANCPICNSFINLLKKKLDDTKIEIIPFTTHAKDFQYVSSQSRVFTGNKAIEEMAKDFPAVTNYFWILPDKYKIRALQAVYKVGSAVRNILPKKKGCNCGKRRT